MTRCQMCSQFFVTTTMHTALSVGRSRNGDMVPWTVCQRFPKHFCASAIAPHRLRYHQGRIPARRGHLNHVDLVLQHAEAGLHCEAVRCPGEMV